MRGAKSKLGQGNPCPNIDHFGDQSFVKIPFHIQNLHIILIKIMVRDYSVIGDHRMRGCISFCVVSMFSDSCL